MSIDQIMSTCTHVHVLGFPNYYLYADGECSCPFHMLALVGMTPICKSTIVGVTGAHAGLCVHISGVCWNKNADDCIKNVKRLGEQCWHMEYINSKDHRGKVCFGKNNAGSRQSFSEALLANPCQSLNILLH